MGVFLEVGRASMRKVVSGIMAYAQQHGDWNVCLPESRSGRSVECWLGGRWDGVIVGFDDPHAVELLQMSVPLVGVGGGFGWYRPDTNIPYVGADNTAVAQLAADHLLQRGLVHFGYCGYTPTSVNGCSLKREEAFCGAIARAGYTCRVFNVPNTASDTWENVCDKLVASLTQLPLPVGLLACNDSRARQVLEACRIAGLRVPEDVAVVGVDNEEALCEFTDPPLTSIDQGAYRIGYEAAGLLDRWMDGQTPMADKRLIPPEGVTVRRSTDLRIASDDAVAAALRFIHEHAGEPISLDDIREVVGASAATIQRRFKAALGRTIHEEIRRVRLERAKQLLLSTDWTFRQIASASGFCSVQHMSKRLRLATGHTPREYRQRYATPLS